MSRETDSPSTGPHGRGGAAYPSGTPPYGTPTGADGGAEAGRSATQPEQRKTETQLTTRVRINIPGSRPIPPVVVRKPVGDSDGSGSAQDTEAPAPAPGRPADRGAEAPAEPVPQAEEKTSDWFAPRRSPTARPAQSGGSANGAGQSFGSGGAAAGAGRPPAGRPGGVVGSMGAPGGSRPGGAPGGDRPSSAVTNEDAAGDVLVPG